MKLWYFAVSYLAGKVENVSCMMYCMFHDFHITCLPCQWLQIMKKLYFWKENLQICDKRKLVAVAVIVGKLTISKVESMVCTACVVCMQGPKLKSLKKRNGIEDLDI